MLRNPSAPSPQSLSAPQTQMNAASQFHHSVDSDSPLSHPHFQYDIDGVYGRRAYDPSNLSFLGPLPSSHDQAMRDFNAWNRSAQGSFPSQPLQGSGLGDPPPPPPPSYTLASTSHKRKRATSPDPASVDGHQSMPSTDEEPDHPTTRPSRAIKFTGRKNSAYEIWVFTRALKTNKIIPADQWPNDYDDFLVKQPRTVFIGCKFCSEFG